MNQESTSPTTPDKPEEPETLDQKRDNVIEKINNLIELSTYVKKKKIDLDELNNEDFDILIYAIEHSNSVHLVQYILDETHYKTLNYAFYDTGKYKSFIVSVIDKQIDLKGYKIPLFTAIALNKFEIADLLLKKNADINYHINGRDYHDIDIIKYLYYMSGFKDFLNWRNLKYILNNGFHIKHINTEMVNRMLQRDFGTGLLEILLKHYVYDNNFIIKLLVIFHFREAVSDKELQQMLTNEKNKIVMDDSVYDNCDGRENYDAMAMILDYDGSEEEIINDRIEDYELLEKGVEYDNYQLVQKILNYPYLDKERLHIEDALTEASKNIQLDILQLLLDYIEHHSPVDWKTMNYEAILGEASRYHNMYYVEERRQKHIKVMQMFIELLLNYSFDNEDLPDKNLSINIDLLKTFNTGYINLILNILIKIDHLKLIKHLLENEELKPFIDINAKDRNGECPLLTAYYSDNMILFKYLLDSGANSHILTKESRPLLSLAIQNKNYNAIKYIFQQKLSFEIDKGKGKKKASENEDENDNTISIFMRMILQNKSKVIQAVVDKETNNINSSEIEVEEEGEEGNGNGIKIKYDLDELISQKNSYEIFPQYGFTYLILAYLLQYHEIFTILLQNSDINELDGNGFSILHYAILKEDISTISLLLSMGAQINYYEDVPRKRRGNSALDMSLAIQNKEIFNIFLNHPWVELNLPDWKSEISIVTLMKLHHFPLDRKLKVMKQLVEKGADVNYVDSSRNTPLIYSIQEKLIPVAEYLIGEGANVNFINNYGYTPLAFAVRKGYLPMVKVLVEHQADINFQIVGKNESKIQSIFMLAVSLGEVEIANYLIDCGVEINFTSISSFYEFMDAINQIQNQNYGHEHDKSNNYNNNNNNNNNNSSSRNNSDNGNRNNNNSNTNNNKIEIFKHIAEKRIHEFTNTIVSEIISWHRLDLMKILVEHHFDVNLRDDQGNIPLTYAILSKERVLTNYLIEQGANIFNVDRNGKTIYEWCCECLDPNNLSSISIHSKIKRLIERHSASTEK